MLGWRASASATRLQGYSFSQLLNQSLHALEGTRLLAVFSFVKYIACQRHRLLRPARRHGMTLSRSIPTSSLQRSSGVEHTPT